MDCQKEFLEQLKCPICLELVIEPMLTSCWHLFCGECIVKTETCPIDRKSFSATRDLYHARRLGDFKVKCPNSEKGCSWLGELRAAEEQTSEMCCYQLFQCTNGCVREMERRHLRVHETTECPQRNFKCPHCPHRGTYSMATTTHFTVCESFPFPCVTGCKRTLTRREMQDHLATTCPKELVACPYKMAGCTTVVKRKNLQKYISDNDHHLQMLIGSYAATTHQVDAISQHQLNPDDVSYPPPLNRPWLQNIEARCPSHHLLLIWRDFKRRKRRMKSGSAFPCTLTLEGTKCVSR